MERMLNCLQGLIHRNGRAEECSQLCPKQVRELLKDSCSPGCCGKSCWVSFPSWEGLCGAAVHRKGLGKKGGLAECSTSYFWWTHWYLQLLGNKNLTKNKSGEISAEMNARQFYCPWENNPGPNTEASSLLSPGSGKSEPLRGGLLMEILKNRLKDLTLSSLISKK